MSRSQTRNYGKFWPTVRPLIWEKVQQLYQIDQARTMGTDYKGITATHKELREGGCFHTAKLIVLRNLYLQNKPSALTNDLLICAWRVFYSFFYEKTFSCHFNERLRYKIFCVPA